MMRACFNHPALAAAAAAVGAVHRRYELGISPQAFEYCDISTKLYQKALRRLSIDLVNNPYSRQIHLLASKLFSVFETFQGNYEAAEQHMTNGLRALLHPEMQTTYRHSKFHASEANYETLKQLFFRLELESVRIFNGPATILNDPEPHEPPHLRVADPDTVQHAPHLLHPSSNAMPEAFTSLHHARDVLFTEAKWIWHTWSLLQQGYLLSGGFDRHEAHIVHLWQWSNAQAEYAKTEVSKDKPQNLLLIQFLKAYREACYLLLLSQMAFRNPETGKEILPRCQIPDACELHRSCRTLVERKAALNTHFARLLLLCECLFDRSTFSTSEEHSMRVDSGIGPPLYMGGTKCPSRRVRHQLTSLLTRSKMQQPSWKTLGVFSIAERLSSVEEHAVMKCGAVQTSTQPKWIDITFFLDERKMLLRYCHADRADQGGIPPGPDLWMGGAKWQEVRPNGLVFTEEWLSF
jgi:hypothetical protein